MIAPTLNERTRRRFAAAEARLLGRGGIAVVMRAMGVGRSTVVRGLAEMAGGAEMPPDRVRRPGGGRKRATELDPTLARDLESLVEPTTRGDPMSFVRWTALSTVNLAAALVRLGHAVSPFVVAGILHDMGYSLQSKRKRREGKQHPDRNAQFQYINSCVGEQQLRGEPAISVDTNNVQPVVMCSEPGHGGVVHT